MPHDEMAGDLLDRIAMIFHYDLINLMRLKL